MGDNDENSVLRRKLRHGADPGQDTARPLIRAFRLGIARTARNVLGLGVDVIGGTETSADPDSLEQHLPPDHLLAFLDAPGQPSGAVALGPELVRALVQQQTSGTLHLGEEASRAFTNTDAALCGPVIDEMLASAGELAVETVCEVSPGGYRFGKRMTDGHGLALALDGDSFRVLDLKLDIAGGAAQSGLTLVFPDLGANALESDAAVDKPALTLADAAYGAPVRLNAIMCRIPLSLGELSGLAVGEILQLPAYRLDRTELLTTSGRSVAHGRLGQVDRLRAVRVNETTSPSAAFVEPPPDHAQTIEARPVDEADPQVGDETLDLSDQDAVLKHISELAGLDEEDAVVERADETADVAQ